MLSSPALASRSEWFKFITGGCMLNSQCGLQIVYTIKRTDTHSLCQQQFVSNWLYIQVLNVIIRLQKVRRTQLVWQDWLLGRIYFQRCKMPLCKGVLWNFISWMQPFIGIPTKMEWFSSLAHSLSSHQVSLRSILLSHLAKSRKHGWK